MDKTDVYGKVAQNLPKSTQFAIVTCLSNIAYGANWGFASLDKVRDFYEDLKKDTNLGVKRINGGFIVEVNPNYILKAADIVAKGVVQQKDIDNMQKKGAEGYVAFEKFLKTKSKQPFESVVGIYCTNATTSITYKGIQYPSFRVNLINALKLLGQYGFEVSVNKVGFVPANVAVNSPVKLYQSMLLSPTNTGVLIKIKHV